MPKARRQTKQTPTGPAPAAPLSEAELGARAHRAALAMMDRLEVLAAAPDATAQDVKAAADAYARLFALARMGAGLPAEPVPQAVPGSEAADFYPYRDAGGALCWRRAGDDGGSIQ